MNIHSYYHELIYSQILYLANEMTGNAMYSYLLSQMGHQGQSYHRRNSKHKPRVASALFQDSERNNFSSDEEDSEIEEAMGDMFNMMGLDLYGGSSAHSNSDDAEPSRVKPGLTQRISNRVSGLLDPKGSRTPSTSKISKIMMTRMGHVASNQKDQLLLLDHQRISHWMLMHKKKKKPKMKQKKNSSSSYRLIHIYK